MDATCSSTPAINTNFYITAGGTGGTPWALTAKQDAVEGWPYQTFCIKCLGTRQSGFFKTTPSNLQIRQVRDCATYIVAATNQATFAVKKLAYSTSTTTDVITLANIFDVRAEADCGVTSCTLVTQSGGVCTTTAFTSTDVTIGASPTYSVTAKRNVVPGYGPHLFCYKCTSSKALPNFHNGAVQTIEFKMSIQQVMDCSTTLVKIAQGSGAPVSPMNIAYVASPALKVYATGFTNIFTQTDVTNDCPVT